MNKILLIACTICFFSVTTFCQNNTFKDVRDGKVYKTVVINNQTWMAENLNFVTENSWCYNDDAKNCEKYGRLYSLDAALKACPNGWRMSDDNDWSALVNTLGAKQITGGILKETGTANWKTPNTGATNSSGFSAIPAGLKLTDGKYTNEGTMASFWSQFADKSGAWGRHLTYDAANLNSYNSPEHKAYSLRCVKK